MSTPRGHWGRLARVVVAIAAIAGVAGALGGCSGETPLPGEFEPRRTADPRSEAIRFFPPGTPAIVLADVTDTGELDQLDAALANRPEWRSEKSLLARSLQAAGLNPDEILGLARTPQDELGLPPPTIVAGTAGAAGTAKPAAKDRLFTLATDQVTALAEIFDAAADAGGLDPAGQFDGASLYRGPGLDFAIRDGVVVAASGVTALKQAITRRDAGPEFQLDEPAISRVLNRLSELTEGVIRIYAVRDETAAAYDPAGAGGRAELITMARLPEDPALPAAFGEATADDPVTDTVAPAAASRQISMIMDRLPESGFATNGLPPGLDAARPGSITVENWVESDYLISRYRGP